MSSCSHCDDNKYVLAYWLEKVLEKHGYRMSSIPMEIFKKIPLEDLCYCHCNTLIVFRAGKTPFFCQDCEDTTWRFTEEGEQRVTDGKKWLIYPSRKLKNCRVNTLSAARVELKNRSLNPPRGERVLSSYLTSSKSLCLASDLISQWNCNYDDKIIYRRTPSLDEYSRTGCRNYY